MDRNEKMIIELKNIIRYLIMNSDGMNFALNSINSRIALIKNSNESGNVEDLNLLSECRTFLLDCEKRRVLSFVYIFYGIFRATI